MSRRPRLEVRQGAGAPPKVARVRRLSSATAALLLLAALWGCGGRDAARPVPEADVGVATTPPPELLGIEPAGAPDPTEPGIPDLARLARYVFREMRRQQAGCSLSNPFHDSLSFALVTEVKGGRIVGARLGKAVLERGPEELPLPGGIPPADLVAYVDCLEPQLKAVEMAPAPADGIYEPVYSYPGHAGTP